MKTIRILVGIPCSGKSTYAEYEYVNDLLSFSISRDDIRDIENLHQYTKESENKVTEIFHKSMETYLRYLTDDLILILDNTHCKEKYIDNIINNYSNYNIEVKFFDISLLKAHYRNIIRYFKTGKWIPIKVMNDMYKNYKKINKQKYAKYTIK